MVRVKKLAVIFGYYKPARKNGYYQVAMGYSADTMKNAQSISTITRVLINSKLLFHYHPRNKLGCQPINLWF